MPTDPQNPSQFAGVSLEYWSRVFDPSVMELGATVYAFTQEGGGFLRIAFGNAGPFTDSNGTRDRPQFTHAVTLPADMAITLAQEIIRHYATVKASA